MKLKMSLLAVMLCLCGTAAAAESTETCLYPASTEITEAGGYEGGEIALAEKQLAQMSLEEKVGQLFFVRSEALIGYKTVADLQSVEKATTKVDKKMLKGLKQYPVGGVVLFAKNILNPEQTKQFIAALRQGSRSKLILAVDEEGGRVARVANNPAMGVENVGFAGNMENVEKAYASGVYIGEYLKALGFDMDLAPVADVLQNKDNAHIGLRSFGSSPEQCGEMASAYIRGLHEQGILSTVKHFPGKGGWEKDSHLDFSESPYGLEELEKTQLISFRKAMQQSDAVMVAHLSLPKIDGKVPASLSKPIITGLLRQELGFRGMVITDALAMGAINKHYGHAEAAVMALQAGADILLMPEDLGAAYKGVLKAVKNGQITQKQLDHAVLNQLRYKY